ncbi:MAG: hypothetical protein OP8BY_1851 [Candidatus Saccharicenans subterraneus]|uniref:Uncharacterized protein n=1 Tax=Candidatus Saccharicenans subterraneus TaxID=2508984 RepID=A0A3E2BNN3_9BACT|nr:MAG: hypothetical protein OP8BY_1851 [Candidatus Saccharicenans subterraneum]
MKNKKYFSPASLLLIFLILLLSGCIERQPIRGLAVNAIFGDRVLTDDLVTRLKVKYITTSSFQPFDRDFRVVAVATRQDRVLFRENLEPETPPLKWQAGRVYEVERYLYFPAIIDPFNPGMVSGLKVEFRIVLENGSGGEPIILYSRIIKLLPRPADSPDVVFMEGWKKVSRLPAGPGLPLSEYWTGERAVCLLKNTGRPAILMIKGRNYSDQVAVSLYLDEGLFDEFKLGPGEFRKIYPIGPFPTASDPELRLTIAVDRTIPLNKVYPDSAESSPVGLKIEKVYFR